jgi:hypothetical protein
MNTAVPPSSQFLRIPARNCSRFARGVESVIPMDEVVEAMVCIGRALPRGLRETAEGGLAKSVKVMLYRLS